MDEFRKVPFNDLRPTNQLFGKNILDGVQSVLDSGRYLYGPWGTQFEQELQKTYPDKTHAVAVANGTDAIELSLRVLHSENPKAKLVITVGNSAPAVVAAIYRAGLTPFFCDVTPAGLMDPHYLAEAIRDCKKDVLAVLPVHTYGQICDMKAIAEVAWPNGISVVEDAAQAMFSTSARCRIGQYSDFVAMSFYPTKALGALGDAGAILCNDKADAGHLRSLAFYGISDRDTLKMDRPGGLNSRISELQAAVLLAKWSGSELTSRQRSFFASMYVDRMPKHILHRPYEQGENYHLFTVVVKNREKVRAYLHLHGVETAIHYPTAPTGARGQETLWLCDHVMSLPLYYGMKPEDVLYVAEAVTQAVKFHG